MTANRDPRLLVLAVEGPGLGDQQKAGFRSAIEQGLDYVAVLPAGSDSSELRTALVLPLTTDHADAVVASSTSRNSVLSRLQNRMLRAHISDYHSGVRAYRTAALRRIPFHLNSSGFTFDTEILIQLMLSGARIVDVTIPPRADSQPTFPGGLKLAKDLMVVCLKARAQELSLFYDRKFDCVPSTVSNVHYKPRLGFDSTHTMALDVIPSGTRVLDIGCAGGYFSHLLRERRCHTTGIDRFPLDEGNELDAFHLHDLDRWPLPVDVSGFDYAVMLDVLEHLHSPETFVDGFRAAASRNPNVRLVISTPNIAFFINRLMLLFGQFNYGKRGILDLTHTRLFTFGTFRRLFEQSGYQVLTLQGVPAPFPLALGNTRLARALLAANKLLIKVSKRLFAFQIFAIVQPKPGLS